MRRVKPIVEVAVARFGEHQRLRRARRGEPQARGAQAGQARQRHPDEEPRIGEDEAYRMLQRMAMDRGKRLGEIAQQLIDMAELLG
jgi:response regulator NasT